MVFDSYMDWLNEVKTYGFNDIILGVKETIKDKTLYISLGSSKVMKFDNTSFAIGYTYNLVLSVSSVDDPLVTKLSDVTQSGLTLEAWSDTSHLYNYVGSVYLPVGKGGQAFQ